MIVALAAPVARTQAPAQSSDSAASGKPDKADLKKAKVAYEQAVRAERQQDWDTAYTAYTDASDWAPDNHDYALHRAIARSRLVQSKVDAAERDAISGRLDSALKQLMSASFIDPTSSVVRERIAELAALEPGQRPKPVDVDLGGEPRLEYLEGHHNFDFRGDTQAAYNELGRQFGVEVAFDVDLRARQIRFQADDVDFPTAARLLGSMTGTFWRALSPRLFFVAENTPQKRKDYDASVMRTVLLPASETPEQMTEITRLVREIAGITRSQLDERTHTLTLRASPQAVALATDLIDDLERPNGELVLEIDILEVDRNKARQLGITPPQTATVYTLSPEQIAEAEASEQGLINVITQVLGTPVPNVIAFGGGATTFFATLPGASADFGEMLSVVKQGRRVLLRAQDGQPATIFVGDRVPVSLSAFSPSLQNGTLTPSTIANPLVNYATGNSPSFIATDILRGAGFPTDLVVANSADNNISVLFGVGDGTFENQLTYPLGKPTDTDPVWITTGTFNTNIDQNIDLAIANKGSNTVSILLGQTDSVTGAPAGTFVAAPDLVTGNAPVSIASANFHDLAGTNFLDLAVANQVDNTVTIFQGKGDGTFAAGAPIQLPAGFTPTSLTTARFTASGHMDLAVSEQSTVADSAGIVQLLFGNGDGTFYQPNGSTYTAGNIPAYVVTGDFNSDGVTDLAVANSGPPTATVSGNSVSIYFGNPDPTQINTGNGTFTAQTTYPAGTQPVSLAVGDFNQDGLPDLIIADETDNAVTILFNGGAGVFGTLIPEIPTGDAPVSVISSDFNGDGIFDAAVADNGSAEATVILNSANLFPTGSTAGGTLFPGAQYLDIGLKVKATPRIHSDDEVTLDLHFDISALTAQSFNAIPVISNQTVDQVVRVKQNKTALVAGFRSVQLSNAMTGNPGIADVPVVGLFDQNQNNTDEGTDLLILVTPRLVRLAPRHDHVVYAGQGSLEGPAPVGEPPPVSNPPAGLQPPGQAPAPPPQEQPPAPQPQGPPPTEPGVQRPER
jgi:Bacterial type II and III secretion system protein/FG-GAP-like repeat